MEAVSTDENPFVSHIELPIRAKELALIMDTNNANLVEGGKRLNVEVNTLRKDIKKVLVDYKKLRTKNAKMVDFKYLSETEIPDMEKIIKLTDERLNELNDEYHAMNTKHTIRSETQDARIKELLAKITSYGGMD